MMNNSPKFKLNEIVYDKKNRLCAECTIVGIYPNYLKNGYNYIIRGSEGEETNAKETDIVSKANAHFLVQQEVVLDDLNFTNTVCFTDKYLVAVKVFNYMVVKEMEYTKENHTKFDFDVNKMQAYEKGNYNNNHMELRLLVLENGDMLADIKDYLNEQKENC